MSEVKIAKTDYPINELLQNRWSPRSFWEKEISPEVMHRLFEAARWTPSSFNEQPWRFFYAHRDTPGFETLLGCLKRPNAEWAQRASVLAIACTHTVFGHSEKENRHAIYDLGQSVFAMTLQAETMGIKMHQMAGFFPEKAKEVLPLGEDVEPITAIAFGYNGPAERLRGKVQQIETEPRKRLSQNEFVFKV